MLTALGKELRKLRLDMGELLLAMSTKLEYSPSYLSAIENGRRPVPTEFLARLFKAYQLTEDEKSRFRKAENDTIDEATIDLRNMNSKQRDVAILLARNFESLNDKSLDTFRKMLVKEE